MKTSKCCSRLKEYSRLVPPSKLSHLTSEHRHQQSPIIDVPRCRQDMSELNSLPCPFRTLLLLLSNVVIYSQIKQCCSEPFEFFCWIRRPELRVCLFSAIPVLLSFLRLQIPSRRQDNSLLDDLFY